MADETRQANVVLTADTGQYSQQMATATTTTNQAADAVTRLFASIERLQRATARRLEIISATAIGGITAATLAAAKFEQQMGQLQASAAITGKNINTTARAVDDLRRNLPVSTEQVIALVGALQKLGASQNQVKSLADTFIKLGAATGEDIGTLTTNLVGLQRAMGTTEGSIKGFADQTAHLSATLGVSATGILQFANNLAPVARTVGMTQTQVMGFSAAFVKAGQDGYAASTVFTKLVTDISRATRYGSNDIYAYANAVGMTAEQFKKLPAAEQATQFFQAISRQGADSIKTLERLGYDGPRALKAIQGLAQSGGLGRALGEANVGFNSGATEKGAAAAMDGLNDSLKKLQNTLTSIGQSFGSTFLPVLTKVVDGVTQLASVVRTAMQPFTALLGVIGLAGGATSGLLGAGISSFSALSTAALAYAALRNPLTAGFRAARATATGNVPSKFVQNTAQNINNASRWQQRFFGLGARAGGVLPTGAPMMGPMTAAQSMRAAALGTLGGGIRGLPGRLALGAAGVYAGAMGLARSSLDPLQYKAIQDATKRPSDSFRESRAAFRAMGSNEVPFRTAVASVTSSTVRLGSSILSATGGIARLGMAATRAAAPMAMRGLAQGGKALWGAVGGLPGAAIMAGMGGFAYASSLNNGAKDFRDRLSDTSGQDSAVSKYATSMGLASTAAMSFADTVNKASNAIVVTSPERARAITAVDIKAAGARGRKLEDESLRDMTPEQAKQYATSVLGIGGVDPKIMQAMKLDIIDVFGADAAKDIVGGAVGGQGMNVGSLVEQYRSGLRGEGKGDILSAFRPSQGLKDSLSQAESTYSQNARYISTQFGEEETQKYTTASVNQLLTKMTGNTSTPQAQAIASTIEQIIGEGNLNLGVGDLSAIQNAQTNTGKQQALYNAIFNNEMATGKPSSYRQGWDALGGQQGMMTYNLPKASLESSLYNDLGVYGTRAGQSLRSNIGTGASINAALASPDDANKQLEAATAWGQQLTEMTGSTTAANLELQNLKNVVQDVSDPLYQMAQAAQQAAQRLQGYQTPYQSRGESARVTAGNLATAYVGRGPDRQQNIIAAEDAYEGARSGLYEQFKSIVKAYREFDIQQQRGQEDFNKQRSRNAAAFYLQQSYSQQDHDLQRERSEDSYERQRLRGQEAYDLQRRQSQEDFDRQRQRSEADFAHQVEVQARSTARGIQDIYTRIQTKPSWDAANLVTNANDQLAKMRQQQADLAKVRELGLSGDAISQLGLNEFGNQQQLARMVGDLANNPELVQQLNESIAGRIDLGKMFTTDPDSESWKEMQRSFNLAADRAVEDFNRMAQRADAAYELGLEHMQDDYTRVTEQGEADYKRMVARQNAAYALSVKQTVDDWNTQTQRAKDDMNRSFEEVTGSFNEMAEAALGQLSGVTKDQYSALKTALGLSREEIKTALSGTSEDMIKLLAPLFGGEEAARKALSSAANSKMITSPSAEWNMNKGKGGPSGSEASYDSASGAHGGPYGTGGANFPLPAGSWAKTSGFGMRHNPVTGIYRLHAGTDLGAKQGTPIGAAEDGIVTKAQVMGGLGNMVEVSHGGGTKTWYGHMSMITSKVGQMVGAGEQIGLVGSTGNSTGPHLHFERHINGQAVDPWGYLQGLQSGQITGGLGDMSAMFGLPPGVSLDLSKNQNLKDLEKGFMNMTPGGMAYTPGLMTTALQSRVNSLTGAPMDSIGGPTGSYGTSPTGPIGARGSYARGGATMSTASITTIQHIDAGTDYNGGIVVVAQDPDEMGRKLAEKKRMKALTRPSRSA